LLSHNCRDDWREFLRSILALLGNGRLSMQRSEL